jgi:hypothetical protein
VLQTIGATNRDVLAGSNAKLSVSKNAWVAAFVVEERLRYGLSMFEMRDESSYVRRVLPILRDRRRA